MSLSKKCYSVFLFTNDSIPIHHKDGIFEIEHETEYKVAIFNHDPKKRADATIFIDGKSIGCFRINANSKIVVERPADDSKARKLTFYDVHSQQGKEGGISESNPSLGILKVVISTEILRQPSPPRVYTHSHGHWGTYSNCADGEDTPDCPMSGGTGRLHADCASYQSRGLCQSDSASTSHSKSASSTNSLGGTALGKDSSQKFSSASFIRTESDRVVIEGRMVLKRRVVVPL